MEAAIVSALIAGAFGIFGIWLQHHLSTRARQPRPVGVPQSPQHSQRAGMARLFTVLYIVVTWSGVVAVFAVNPYGAFYIAPVLILFGVPLALLSSRAGHAGPGAVLGYSSIVFTVFLYTLMQLSIGGPRGVRTGLYTVFAIYGVLVLVMAVPHFRALGQGNGRNA